MVKRDQSTQVLEHTNQKYQVFIDNLYRKQTQWERYSGVLTNETKFDSKALMDKYKKGRNKLGLRTLPVQDAIVAYKKSFKSSFIEKESQ